jgi:hypothetical protein
MSQTSADNEHLRRVRRICGAMQGVTEKLSHGEPTFFVHKRVFCMFANNHHSDGHVAVWIPAAPGHQEMLVHTSPDTFFRPPYVGVAGWVGVELERVGDEELTVLIGEAWRLVEGKQRKRSGGRGKAVSRRPG